MRLRNEVHAWWLENWGHRDDDATIWKIDVQLIQKIADTPARHWSDSDNE